MEEGIHPKKNASRWVMENQPPTNRSKMDDEFVHLKKTTKVIKVEKAQDNFEWLGRSLTCISDSTRDIDSLRLMISYTLHENFVVRDLGKIKFLLTLDSKEIKERLKNDDDECLKAEAVVLVNK